MEIKATCKRKKIQNAKKQTNTLNGEKIEIGLLHGFHWFYAFTLFIDCCALVYTSARILCSSFRFSVCALPPKKNAHTFIRVLAKAHFERTREKKRKKENELAKHNDGKRTVYLHWMSSSRCKGGAEHGMRTLTHLCTQIAFFLNKISRQSAAHTRDVLSLVMCLCISLDGD